MEIPYLLAMTALMSASSGIGQAQSTSPDCPSVATCDTSTTQCLGYGDLTIRCANGTTVNFGTCYQSDVCASAAANQGNDWIRVTVDNINPKQCHSYSQAIKQSMLTAYNSWCCQGNNFLKCCPNSAAWPAGAARSAANCMAMQDATMEVAYAAASGSPAQTRFFLQLRPRRDSPLCRLVTNNFDAINSAATTASSATSAAVAATAYAASNASTAAATAAAAGNSSAAGSTPSPVVAASNATTANATSTTGSVQPAASSTIVAANTSPTPASSTVSSTSGSITSITSSTSTSTSSTSTSTSTSTTTTRAKLRRKRRQSLFADVDRKGGFSMSYIYEAINANDGKEVKNKKNGLAKTDLSAAHLVLKRSASVAVTLDPSTVKALITDVNVPNLIVTAIGTASNGSVTVTVTVVQNVAPASNLTPDLPSYGWVIATSAICGLVAAILVTYMIACAIHRSKRNGSRLAM